MTDYPRTPRLGLPLVPDKDRAWGPAMRQAMTDIDVAVNTRASVIITLTGATGTVDLGKAFRIDGEVASAPGRFRLYRTAAGRDADLARIAGTDAPPSVGLLLEDNLVPGELAIAAIPAAGAPSGGTLCAWSWSGALGSTITLDVLISEG